MDWLEVNGASLRYELSGRGGETVLLVHELGGALDSWDPVMPALRALRWGRGSRCGSRRNIRTG